MSPTLELFHKGNLVFSSAGSWLHPLFEVEQFLAASALDPGQCLLRDKLIGKAAALLIVRMGFREVHAGILSEPGEAGLSAHAIRYEAIQRVERILCRTEELLADTDDPDQAYERIRQRIEHNGARS